MKVKIKKTDRRHSGHDVFSHIAEVEWPGLGRRTERMQAFIEVRRWCWDTFGMSCEREHWLELYGQNQSVPNERWCWHTDYGNFKIYLRTEKEANWFRLKWQ